MTASGLAVLQLQSVGFLGCGNLGQSILAGMLKRGLLAGARVQICSRTSAQQTAEKYREHGVTAVDAETLVASCEVVILGIKPDQLIGVCSSLRFRSDQLVISLLAGVSFKTLLPVLQPARVVMCMPNVVASIGQSMTMVVPGPSGSSLPADVQLTCRLFEGVGYVEVLPSEDLLHAGTAVASCGVAYFFLAIEAMADAGVAAGLPRKTALRLAAGAVSGAGQLALQSGQHPGVLKDSVTSPGGLTIQAVRVLERHGFRSALFEAVTAAADEGKARAAKIVRQDAAAAAAVAPLTAPAPSPP